MDRVILHCDMNSFYASVELLDHPELRDLPVAVAGDPEHRHGSILAKNQAAMAFDIRTAETVWQAKKKCPDLVLLPPHHEKYRDYSHRLNQIYQEYTDMVEPFSVDESWLDVTDSQRLFGSGRKIADTIRERVRRELGLTLSAGVSYNKIFAKMGSEYKKPDATTEITRENYQKLLWPLPVGDLFFVGFATAEKLMSMGVRTIGDLARADREALSQRLGAQGPLLRSYARGEDRSPVRRYDQKRKIQSVGHGLTFSRDLVGEQDIRTALTRLSDMVAVRLRRYQLKARGIRLEMKGTDLRSISRQQKLDAPTDLASEIREAAFSLVRSAWPMDRPIRLLTVTGYDLTDEEDPVQLSLFSGDGTAAHEKNASVERTMDRIRDKFGDDAIGFAGLLHNDIGIDL